MTYDDFKRMPFYRAFEDWFYSEISGDYYYPETYSDEGDLIGEAEFDAIGCERTVEKTTQAVLHLYDHLDQNPNKLRGKSGEELLQIAGINDAENISYIGLYCGLFLCVIADYPNFRDNFKYIWWCAFVEIIDGLFDRQDLLTWLNFYSQFKKYRTFSIMPAVLREDRIMPYWKKLQDKGFVNDEYQIIYSKGIKNYHVAAIANNFRLKTDCTWRVLEQFFISRSKKPFSNLRDEYDKTLRRDSDEFLNSIEECFK